MESERRVVASDADILMNLLASGFPVDILQALNVVLLVAPRVDGEALYLESENPGGDRVLIDLNPLEAAGVVSRISLTDDELDLVVQLVREVDDGEAEVIAVGVLRNVEIATDDRKARRVAAERGGSLLSTPELLVAWQSSASIPDQTMTAVVRQVSRRSRYRPARMHPLYGGWMQLLSSDETPSQ